MAYDLKKEEDVKEYLENLGIEYRFSCFHENKAEGCHLLGDYLEAIKQEFAKAAEVYKMNCDKYQYGKSCNKYGGYRFHGKGCDANTRDAYNYFKKGCDLKCPKACHAMGLLENSSWEDHEPNPAKSLSYFERGCEGNDERSCYQASSFYIKGREGAFPKDLRRAFELAEKGCDLGDLKSCVNVSIMYRNGDGVTKNEEMAAKYKNIALEIQDQMKKQFRPITFS